jgi:hypothetical protein
MSEGKYKPPGVKTSVYLTPELAERVKADGRSLRDLAVSALDAAQPTPLEAVVEAAAERGAERAIRRLLTDALPESASADTDCPHPKARVNKGLCGACGQHVA